VEIGGSTNRRRKCARHRQPATRTPQRSGRGIACRNSPYWRRYTVVEVSTGGGGDETCCSLVVVPLEHPANSNWPVRRDMASTRDRVDLVAVIVFTPKELSYGY
jgi:hypothetical protein